MTESKMKYPRGTVLKWTRNAMARAYVLSPHDRLIVLDGPEHILYDCTTNEVRQTDYKVWMASDLQPAETSRIGNLRISVRDMSDDPDIPALIQEFGMVED